MPQPHRQPQLQSSGHALPTAFPSVTLIAEAATAAGSVALVRDGLVLADREVTMGASREDMMLPAIQSALLEANLTMRDVRAIACGSGPGSFTSLRIAASLCKGFARASDLPLYAIPSLLLAALSLRSQSGRYLLHSDALRGERFAQEFAVDENGMVQVCGVMQRLPLVEVECIATEANPALVLVAVGAQKVSALDVVAVLPRARNAALLSEATTSDVEPAFSRVDIARWEPTYGRLAEAQVKWEATHHRTLPSE